ncbi:MAG: AMP nucleosidase [Waddliaceae bacterium]|jgi:AMP nucleosidase|nr:AMP nucleosidase [Waddliaceae bacterium]MBT3578711.1 AMP nucleosidase [Waddliaceae bacterium]MBT4444387.1 AMP nucleosidase [Waddliaceae bacterium]MBT6928302.1 AMP nucleosidase [Waddliaceae bacterium]MBT7264988.1 AMP nucleosidase [Waddliaceae bacterium]
MIHKKRDLKNYDPLQVKIARDTLERYSNSPPDDFCSYLFITNFPKYLEYFADARGLTIVQGPGFNVAHSPEDDISIIDFRIGSPTAALLVDCCAFLPIKAILHLGMCGGLRRSYSVGDYFVPVASIRGEGTSDFYFPSEVPAMANFQVQKAVTNALEKNNTPYHIGICHTTNKRFWEFDEDFIARLKASRAQSIEMESATLFCASYKYKIPMGALYIISDLPLEKGGIKTKKSAKFVLDEYTADHVDKGVEVVNIMKDMLNKQLSLNIEH